MSAAALRILALISSAIRCALAKSQYEVIVLLRAGTAAAIHFLSWADVASGCVIRERAAAS